MKRRFLYSFFSSVKKNMLLRKVAIANDCISPYTNQAMRGGIDERNATGQKVLCQKKTTDGSVKQ